MRSASSEYAASADSVLSVLIDEMTERLNRGESVDVEKYIAEHPDLSSPLRQIHQTLTMLREPASGVAPASVAMEASMPGQLGDFRIGRELGHGGMGIVYEAEQISLARKVALKVLPLAGLLDKRQLQRFRNEARAAASLHHPHIVPVYAVGEDRSVHFYAMQHIAGQSLAEAIGELRDESPESAESRVLRVESLEQDEAELVSRDAPAERASGQQPIANSQQLDTTVAAAISTKRLNRSADHFRAIARLIADIADALHHAHESGVVHRDVKPSNILIDGDGHAWITDFGLAMTDANASTLTLSGDLVGTLRYMSPGQAEGQHALVDRRTDVYSLGITLYELATGEPAFPEANHGRLLRRISDESPSRPRQVQPRIPRDLETIILKSTDKQPYVRYNTAAEFADDLRRFASHQPIKARRAGRFRRTLQWGRRNKLVATLTAVAALLLVVLAVAAAVVAVRERRHSQDLLVQQYISDIGLAASEIEFGKTQRAGDILDRYTESDLRGFEWHYLRNQCRRQQTAVKFQPPGPVWMNGGTMRDIEFSPDGRLLAVACWSNNVQVWDVNQREMAYQFRIPGKPLKVAFSPDGSLLAAGTEVGRLHVWETAGSSHVETNLRSQFGEKLQIKYLSVRDIAFSPDGKWLIAAIGSGDSSLLKHENGNGALLIFERDDIAAANDFNLRHEIRLTSSATCVEVFPDGEAVLVGCSDGDLVGIRKTDQQEEFRLHAHDDPLRSLAISPDGSRWVTASYDETIKIFDAESRALVKTLVGHFGEVRDVAISPDGQYLLSASFDRSIRLWVMETGQEVKTIWGHSGPVWCVAISPKGEWIASGSVADTAQLWPFDADVQRSVVSVDVENGAWALTFSADGSKVAAATEGGNIWIANAESGKEIAYFRDAPSVGALAFSPDGRFLVRGGGNWHLGYVRSTNPDVPHDGTGNFVVWDVATQMPLARKKAHGATIRSAIVTPRGDRLLTVSLDGSVIEWEFPDLGRRTTVRSAKSPTYSAALAPNGQLLALGTSKNIEIWRRDNGSWKHYETLRGHSDWVAGLAFSPNGRRLASASFDGTSIIWDAQELMPLHRLTGDNNWRMSVSFSRDSRTLAVAQQDFTIKLYHVETGSELLTLKDHNNWVLACAFSPTDDLLVSSATGGDVRFWRTK